MADGYVPKGVVFDDDEYIPKGAVFDDAPAPRRSENAPLTVIPSGAKPTGIDPEKGRQYNVGETALMHGARGIAGRWPEKAAAALTATIGSGPEGTWGERYDAALESTTDRYDKSAAQNPGTAATSGVAGAVLTGAATGGLGTGTGVTTILAKEGTKAAIKELAKRAAINATVNAAQGASYGAKEGAASAGIGGVSSALTDAFVPAGWGRLAKAGAAVARQVPTAFTLGMSYKTLSDPNATEADKIAAVEQAALPALGWVGKKPAEKRAVYERNEQDATSALVRRLANEAREKGWVNEDLALKQKRNNEDRAYFAQAAAERENMKRDDLARGIGYATEDVATQQTRNQNRAAAHDARIEDQQIRQGRAVEDIQRAEGKAENDRAKRQGQLVILEKQRGLDLEMAEYQKAKEAHSAALAEHTDKRRQIEEGLKADERLGAAAARLREQWEAEGKALRAEIPTMAEALASAEGKYGQFHGEMHSRLSNYLMAARELGQEPDNDLIGILAQLNKKREELTRGGKQDRIEDMLAQGREAWTQQDAQRTVADATAAAEAASKARGDAPDFFAAAAEQQAEKTKLRPEQRSLMEKRWREAGHDPTGLSDDALRAGWDVGPAPAAPIAPDSSDLDKTRYETRKADLEQPVVAHTLGATRRLEDTTRRLGRLDAQGAPIEANGASRRLETQQRRLARLEDEGDNTPMRFDRRDEDLARAQRRAAEAEMDAVPSAADEAAAQRQIADARRDILKRMSGERGRLEQAPDLVGEYARLNMSPVEWLMSTKLGHFMRSQDGRGLSPFLERSTADGRSADFSKPASAAAIYGDLARFGGKAVPRAYYAGRGAQSAATSLATDEEFKERLRQYLAKRKQEQSR